MNHQIVIVFVRYFLYFVLVAIILKNILQLTIEKAPHLQILVAIPILAILILYGVFLEMNLERRYNSSMRKGIKNF